MLLFWCLLVAMLILALSFIAWPVLALPYKTASRTELCGFAVLVLALPVLALLLYKQWGSGPLLSQAIQAEKSKGQIRQALKNIGTPDQVIEKLQTRLAKQPDAKGWYLLGQLYLSQGQLNQALAAYTKANALKPDDSQINLRYAEALLLKDATALNHAKQLIETVLKQQPANEEALNIKALIAFQQADYRQAIALWEQLLTHIPAASEDGKKLLEAIAKAQAAQQTPELVLNVAVELSATLSAGLNPKDTVFIYAQALTGPKVPLAITRRQVKDLPLQLTLDETMSMLPSMTLQSVDHVRIVARVSPSGQAMPKVGDWLGMSEPVNPHQPPKLVRVVIAKAWQDS
jgi:cytochrome c-type biogenesis protein CcmH